MLLKCLTCSSCHFLRVGSVDVTCRRWANKSFRKTVNLPSTNFPLSMKGQRKREIDIQKTCSVDHLYNWQESQTRDKLHVLHDGPPYANGKPHVGHAINKILKDVTNRYKLLRGFNISYVPGWDCHGVPIEQKALEEIGRNHTKMRPLEIRSAARAFAEKTILEQKATFRNWGVMADWTKCYFTFDKDFEAKQLEVFFQMFEKGFIYQDYMPVYWSPSSRTALAEAELEYNEHHKSTAVYVKFPILQFGEALRSVTDSKKAFAVIWTTTPWTLPANKAICYSETLSYSLVQDEEKSEVFVIATTTLERLSELLGKKLEPLHEFEGRLLEGSTYEHPLLPGSEYRLLPAAHVSTEKGSGLVHTAPAHGREDFQVATKFGLPVDEAAFQDCTVDVDGLYTSDDITQLKGKSVLTEGNEIVLDLLKDYIMHTSEYEHSYPYDWRTKQPVILKASKQWFVNTSELTDKALEVMQNVRIVPSSSRNGMTAKLASRPYWCISRQRVWGVPIPVFYNEETGKPLISRSSIDHLKALFLEHGSDCWWTKPVEELLPRSVLQQSNCEETAKFTKETDVLDIWFDSGSTWAAVLGDEVADVYLEGIDQYGGWFQSSLFTSLAVNNRAPYKCLVVHGFAVDEDGKKMSKSVGNVVDPQVVIDGGKNQEKDPGYGVDVFRWWTTHSPLDPLISIGPNILDNCQDQVYQIRKTLRFLLSNLGEFDASLDAVEYSQLQAVDKYMLHLVHGFQEKVISCYEEFSFPQVAGEVEQFVNSHVSNFYSNVTKDRLYCEERNSAKRRSVQTVMYRTLEVITKTVAPILPHLAEEIFQYVPFQADCDSIFKTLWEPTPDEWRNPDLAESFEHLFEIKDAFTKEIQDGVAIPFSLYLSVQPELFEKLKPLQDENPSSFSSLCDVLQASQVSLFSRPPIVVPDDAGVVEGTCSLKNADGGDLQQKFLLLFLTSEQFLCGRCRRYTADKHDHLCSRCDGVLGEGWEGT